ncbi:alpha/beta fold hydrolase [Cupriavidus metallidurans]|uniref:Alpha/beta hydrolase fold protein n=1 Tax=Cupriavidus metallidurans (strain ATCC 43123 / DSM 2839 / NBRC 102507 / CH34) TaxID=266264 RepID=Q1LFG8_CUPMC|nr:alpha/beta hydrolase [Cupriavidus metallidurans]ABF11108.1 alpha/beta hydrolase fold protein [Cupriavidus metallidurans CH34]
MSTGTSAPPTVRGDAINASLNANYAFPDTSTAAYDVDMQQNTNFTESSTDLLPGHVLGHPGALLLGLPGGGCSPAIFDYVKHDALQVHGVDWASWPGPWDLESLTTRLARVLQERKGPTLLAGHSLGGMFALLTTLKAGHKVNGLLLSNTGAHTAGHGDANLPDRVRNAWTEEASDAFLLSCFQCPPPVELWQKMREYMVHINREAFLEAVITLRQIDVRKRLSEIACPAVIAHGRHDQRRAMSFAQELADGIPRSALVWIDGGHTPMVDDPQAYHEALNTLVRLTGITG